VKPNLFIVGAPKCGTTAWVEYLSSHPDIFFSPMKEPHYFNTDFPSYRWVKDEDSYVRLFEGGASRVLGEASVFYLYSTVAARSIRDFNPDAKIVILLREQERFLPSLHTQLVTNGDETISDFSRAWQMSGNRDSSNTGRFCRDTRLLDYKAIGAFSAQVERYFDCFPPEQIRVLRFSEWTRNPRAAYGELLKLLGLPDDGRTEFPAINKAQRPYAKWLTPLLRKPPAALTASVELFKRATNRESLRLGASISRFNQRKGYVSPVPDRLHEEIRQFYEADNTRLERWITRIPAA
jgi:hypothetical protein